MGGLDAAHALHHELDGRVIDNVLIVGGHARVGETVGQLENAGDLDLGHALLDDLRNATAYISFMSDSDDEARQAMEGLRSAKGFIRSTIAGRLNLRYMPDLVLKRDTLIRDSMKLDALIAKGLHKD